VRDNTIQGNTATSNAVVYFSGWEGDEFVRNTLSGNIDTQSPGITMHVSGRPTVRYNNFLTSGNDYEIYNASSAGSVNLDATNNWWGTIDQTVINRLIFDWFDHPNHSLVFYRPFALDPIPDAPPDPEIQVMIPDFDLSVSTGTLNLNAGGSTGFTIDATSLKGNDTQDTRFLDDQAVHLAVGGLPREVTATLTVTDIVPSGSSQVTLETSPQAPPGTYQLWAWGRGKGGTHAVPITLTLSSPEPPPAPGPCGWDAYETNDTDALAYTIAAGRSVTATICGPDDDDWYRVFVPLPYSTFTTTLSHLP